MGLATLGVIQSGSSLGCHRGHVEMFPLLLRL